MISPPNSPILPNFSPEQLELQSEQSGKMSGCCSTRFTTINFKSRSFLLFSNQFISLVRGKCGKNRGTFQDTCHVYQYAPPLNSIEKFTEYTLQSQIKGGGT